MSQASMQPEAHDLHLPYKSIWINKSSVNPKSTSNQSSKPCTVLQYPSRKVRQRYSTNQRFLSKDGHSLYRIQEQQFDKWGTRQVRHMICINHTNQSLIATIQINHSSLPYTSITHRPTQHSKWNAPLHTCPHLHCRSFSTKEPLNIGHFCGKWPIFSGSFVENEHVLIYRVAKTHRIP